MLADVKVVTDLELLEEEYQELDVEIPNEETALHTLL